MSKSENNKQYYNESGVTFDKLLWPMSTILASVIIACSVLFTGIIVSRNTITKDEINKLIAAIPASNSNNGTTTAATDTTPEATISTDQIKALFKDENVVFGEQSRKVTFIEFADPSCPYCHAAAGKNPELNNQIGAQFKLSTEGGTYYAPVPEMKKLVDEGKANYIWVYTNGHGNGRLAAQALYCADEKGKFWQVHDKLMTMDGYNLINNDVKNDKANSGKLAAFVKDQVDESFLKGCLESAKYENKLDSDESLATSIGVRGTPGYFVNTLSFPGAYNFTDMKSDVEAALK